MKTSICTVPGGGVGIFSGEKSAHTFANLTGGYAWFPRFEGEMSDIFDSWLDICAANTRWGLLPQPLRTGKFHKLKVDAVDDQGNPLTVNDKRGKKKKTIVHARQGYMAVAASAMN